mmetsp:Transcript_9598/g.29675  ORF Transcript_9598/g.29675 Transcript_9598/m.29675 type:complete len:243 (-) Transcript_9598:1684-2412(-)
MSKKKSAHHEKREKQSEREKGTGAGSLPESGFAQRVSNRPKKTGGSRGRRPDSVHEIEGFAAPAHHLQVLGTLRSARFRGHGVRNDHRGKRRQQAAKHLLNPRSDHPFHEVSQLGLVGDADVEVVPDVPRLCEQHRGETRLRKGTLGAQGFLNRGTERFVLHADEGVNLALQHVRSGRETFGSERCVWLLCGEGRANEVLRNRDAGQRGHEAPDGGVQVTVLRRGELGTAQVCTARKAAFDV